MAPLIGMIMAFIISLWFIYSFRRGFLPRFISVAILLGVAYFLYTHLETDPAKLKSHFESYFWKVFFYSKNFKWILLCFILTIMAIFTFWLNTLNAAKGTTWFKRLQLVSSAAFSIGHGGNDAQKVMGIITAALIANGDITQFEQMPFWVPLACYTAISLGTISGGWKIIKTMGTRITKVTPFEGVAAETAGAITLFVTEALKIPVSTTHTITGSIIGVGATKRLSAVRWGVTLNLLWAWILTIPVSAALAALVYFIVNVIF
jgi:PiT family inorganic phosphate transporter